MPKSVPKRRVEASGHDNEVTHSCSLHLASKRGSLKAKRLEHFTVRSLLCNYLSHVYLDFCGEVAERLKAAVC